MNAEIGHIALILAFAVALLQGFAGLSGAQKSQPRMMEISSRAALAQFLLVALAFIGLTLLFITSDFSVKLVAAHSHTQKPLLYKISGVWANHEGSILLWCLILAGYGAFIPILGRALPARLRARAVGVQGLLGAGFLAFILFTSNPFERLNPVPANGHGLNPLLQDPGLAIHPPFLYLGYVGFSVPFAFAIAALIEGRIDAIWAKWLRPWVLLAWSFLTIGITLGSFWAYYELGWGGWWMWDPVENVSFMPWLAGTALLHSILVLGTRHTMASWTVLLAITTFALSLIGTFIVRSGVLVSVHAFAVDPERGVFILLLLSLTTGAALTLYALRAQSLRAVSGFNPISREGALILNNLLLIAAMATVFLGTFYPLFIETINGSKISVGAPYFNQTFGPIMCGLILFMGVGPLLKWREDRLSRIKRPLAIAALIFILTAGLIWIFGKSALGAIVIGLAAWMAVGTVMTLRRKIKWGEVERAESWALLRAQPAAVWGFVGAHLGLAIFTAAVASMSVWADMEVATLKPGETITLGKYEFTLGLVTQGTRENYQWMGSDVIITKITPDTTKRLPVTTVHTERRFYPIREQITTEAGLHLSFGQTLFASIGEGTAEDGFVLQVYRHPFVVWIWLGALMMALSGFISLMDRRLRLPRYSPTPVAEERHS